MFRYGGVKHFNDVLCTAGVVILLGKALVLY